MEISKLCRVKEWKEFNLKKIVKEIKRTKLSKASNPYTAFPLTDSELAAY